MCLIKMQLQLRFTHSVLTKKRLDRFVSQCVVGVLSLAAQCSCSGSGGSYLGDVPEC